jgi:hypothetical protein
MYCFRLLAPSGLAGHDFRHIVLHASLVFGGLDLLLRFECRNLSTMLLVCPQPRTHAHAWMHIHNRAHPRMDAAPRTAHLNLRNSFKVNFGCN